MKRKMRVLTVLLVLVALVALPMIADAQPPGPPTVDVSVVNTPDVKAQQEGDWTVEVGNREENPVNVRAVPGAIFPVVESTGTLGYSLNDERVLVALTKVPVGKVLIVDYVSSIIVRPSGWVDDSAESNVTLEISEGDDAPGGGSYNWMGPYTDPVLRPDGSKEWHISKKVCLYIRGGGGLYARLHNYARTNGSVSFHIQAHMVDQAL